METENIKANLDQFTGTENYYRHPFGLKYTDGVKYLAETVGAYWLIDLIVSWQSEVKKKLKNRQERDFQAWTLSKTEKGFRATCTNGNEIELVYQDIEYSDFPENLLPFNIWAIDGVILLPSEY